MDTKKVIVYGVTSSLFASLLFLYFLDPILKFVGYLVLNVGASIFESYIDRLVRQASLMSGPDPAFSVLLLLIGTTWFLSIIATLYMVFKESKRLSSIKLKTSKILDNKKFFNSIVIILSIGLTITSFMLIFGTAHQKKIITSFDQHLVAIAPYTTEQNIISLKSRFAQMESRADYNKIYAELETIAKKNNVKLLDNYVYSLSGL